MDGLVEEESMETLEKFGDVIKNFKEKRGKKEALVNLAKK